MTPLDPDDGPEIVWLDFDPAMALEPGAEPLDRWDDADDIACMPAESDVEDVFAAYNTNPNFGDNPYDEPSHSDPR